MVAQPVRSNLGYGLAASTSVVPHAPKVAVPKPYSDTTNPPFPTRRYLMAALPNGTELPMRRYATMANKGTVVPLARRMYYDRLL